MAKQNYNNNKGFSLIEVIGVLFIICIIISILLINPITSYNKFKERLAVNEIVSDINFIQSKSLVNNNSSFIEFYENSNEYKLYYDNKSTIKQIKENGLSGTGLTSLKFRYNKGNVNISNTILVNFKNSKYEIIIHLETGYITVNEK